MIGVFVLLRVVRNKGQFAAMPCVVRIISLW